MSLQSNGPSRERLFRDIERNAVVDDGIDLKRKPKPFIVPAPEKPAERDILDVSAAQGVPAVTAIPITHTPDSDEPIKINRIRVNTIVRTVADHYGITLTDILSERRTANVVKPRQIAMWLAKTLTGHGYPFIGTRMGGRDHTTVLHAFRKIERVRQVDGELQAQLDELVHKLAPHQQFGDDTTTKIVV